MRSVWQMSSGCRTNLCFKRSSSNDMHFPHYSIPVTVMVSCTVGLRYGGAVRLNAVRDRNDMTARQTQYYEEMRLCIMISNGIISISIRTSTALQHGITARYYSTVLQHGITARYYSTVLQHGITARYYSTVLQHGITARALLPELYNRGNVQRIRIQVCRQTK